MLILARILALYTGLHCPVHVREVKPQRKPLTAIQLIARDYPECVDEYGTDGLSGLDPDELRDACQEW